MRASASPEHHHGRAVAHVTNYKPLTHGGMQRHAQWFAELMSARGWDVHGISPSRPLAEWRVPPSPAGGPTVALIDAWEWTELAPPLRAAWPEVPIVARSGGGDMHHLIAIARVNHDAAGFAGWVDAVTSGVDLLITNSAYSAQRSAVSFLGGIPTAVVSGGAAVSSAALLPRDGEVPSVVVVARLHPMKGVDECIDAVALAQRSGELRLVVVGDGGLRESLEARARERLRPGSWRFTGGLARGECLAEIARADVLLSMSRVVHARIGHSNFVVTETMGRSSTACPSSRRPSAACRRSSTPGSGPSWRRGTSRRRPRRSSIASAGVGSPRRSSPVCARALAGMRCSTATRSCSANCSRDARAATMVLPRASRPEPPVGERGTPQNGRSAGCRSR
jgi:glycosyltransferase involved in cell wall biosynthesis